MMLNGLYENMTSAEYHSLEGYLSNSYLSRLNICPAAARVRQEETDAMRLGTAFHAFILDGAYEYCKKVVTEPPDINRRTKEGKEVLSDFYERYKDKTIITLEEEKAIFEMDKAVKAHPMAKKLISTGTNEVSIFWDDPFSGLPCKARPDKVAGERVLVDLKSCKDSSPRGFQSSIVSFGYFRQAAFYLDGMKKVTGEDYDIFVFIAVEKAEPYRVGVYYLSDGFIEYGRNDYQRLIALESRCRMNNEWPNFTDSEATEIDIPKYLTFGG